MLITWQGQNNGNRSTHQWILYVFSLLQAASRTAAYELGFVPSSKEAASTPAKFLYLLNADEINAADIPKDAFVVYQGHHGDVGAQYADVILPGSAFTEKNAT